MESSGVRDRLGPRGVCCGEWSGVHCRDLPESSGWDVWWSGTALCLSNLREARMFPKLLMSPQLWGALGADAAGGSHLL